MKRRKKYRGAAKWIECFLAKGLVGLLRCLPVSLAYVIGRALGWLLWLLLTARRRAVRTNLRIIADWARDHQCDDLFGEMNTEQQVREVFMRTGANMICGFSLSGKSPEKLSRHIEFVGAEVMQKASEGGKGVVLLLCHMGPWEALAHLSELFKANGIPNPLGAMYRKFNNDYLEDWYLNLRESKGTQMFSSRYKFYAPVDFVRNGGVLGVLSDQRASGGEEVTYFGKPTYCTPLPGLIHLRSKSPWLALSLGTIGFARWRITIHHVPSHLEGRERDRQALAQTVAHAAEKSLMTHILDGFWLNNRFKDFLERLTPSAGAETVAGS